jgi:hypothetical protein
MKRQGTLLTFPVFKSGYEGNGMVEMKMEGIGGQRYGSLEWIWKNV